MAALIEDEKGVARLELGRRDFFRLGGFILGIVGAMTVSIVPLMGYIFQTRHDALMEHASIKQTAALAQQELKLIRISEGERDGRVDKSLADAKKILQTLDINQRTLMRVGEVPRWRIKALPAGIDFSDIEVE